MKFKIAYTFLFLLFFHLVLPRYTQAADCGDGYDCQSPWGCWPGGWCCRCPCGDAAGEYGEFQCMDPGGCIKNGNDTCTGPGTDKCCRYGCKPCAPAPTAGPTNTPIPTATPPPPQYWICKRPYAQSPPKCDYEEANYCVNFDIPGGLCYKDGSNCESGCIPLAGTTLTPRPSMNPLCTFAPGRYGISSAIGCIPVDSTNDATIFILRWAIGVSSGIVFLLIIYSAFLIMGSGGNSEKVKAGKQLMTAALTGLVLLIFSVFVLDIFGLRIFRIPGL